MTEFIISPTLHPPCGTLRVPADKSISHRAVILAAIADGDTRIENFLPSETTHATLDCLRALGAEIETRNATSLIVHGRGLRGLREPNDVLFCKGSGTTIRLLAGLCAGQNFLSILDGRPELKRRPMARVVEPLRAMGATILGRDDGKLPPLAIRGGNLHGAEHTLNVASAQVKSALLLAALFADSPTIVREPSQSRDHTERMLRECGVALQIANCELQIQPITNLVIPNSQFAIPNDFSSAAFFIVAALIVPQSQVRIENVGVNATRTGMLDALARMGASIKLENVREESGEPVADAIVRASRSALRATEIAGDQVPRMIDEFPILAIAATQARGETLVRDARELRVKESDRIATLAQEIRKMGAQIEERADGFVIAGPTLLRGARVNAHNDHRLAMALAIAALIARGETVIEGWECVADSFPNFDKALEAIR